MIVHLVDGSYELFRHFYGRRRTGRGEESFRNRLWPGHQTGDGIDRAHMAQFQPFEEADDRDGGRRRAGLGPSDRRGSPT